MNLLNSTKCDFLERVTVCLIGVFFFAYIIFNSYFAEININLKFLEFPIFIGEILLLICLTVFLFNFRKNLAKISRPVQVAGAIYVLFILLKAGLGYVQWGPLAFRHAALFYYPLFSLLTYLFVSKPRSYQIETAIVFVAIVLLFIARAIHPPWVYSCFLLGICIVSQFKSRKTKVVLLTVLCLFLPVGSLFNLSRTIMVGNMVSMIFILSGFLAISKLKAPIKILIMFLGVMAVLFGFFQYADRNAVQTILNSNKVFDVYSKYNAKLEPVRSSYVVTRNKSTKIYNPNVTVIEDINHQPAENIANSIEVKNDTSPALIENIALPNTSPVRICRSVETANINSAFRLFIWRDMAEEFFLNKPLFGFQFGYPLRSKSLEILGWAESEWTRDGWISSHNSYLHIIYSAGLVGLGFIIVVFFIYSQIVIFFVKIKSLTGILLCGIILTWLVSANFLPILELPYTAIPIWCVFGATFAYYQQKKHLLAHK